MMNQVLDHQFQSLATEAICHSARMAGESIQQAAAGYGTPSAIYRPRISVDGDQWCALYGEDLQSGVAGFGKSPADAMWDFDRNWYAKLPEQKVDNRAEEVLRAHGFPAFRVG